MCVAKPVAVELRCHATALIYEELTKVTFELSSNTHLISFSAFTYPCRTECFTIEGMLEFISVLLIVLMTFHMAKASCS